MKLARAPIDRVFLYLIGGELLFGIIMLTSASFPLSFSRFGNGWYYATHQLFLGIVPGIIGLLIFSRISLAWIERHAGAIFFFGAALMLLVFVPGLGATYGTAKSWIVIAGKFSFQPVEAFKLAFVVYLAALFSKASVKEPRTWITPFLFLLGTTGVLLMLQPDLGSLLLLLGTALTMIFSAGVPLWCFALALSGGSVAAWLFIKNAPYRAARLMVFLHPELDPRGIGYQINQALLAIGSGGIFGLGLGHSRQKFQYLPEVINDSIFPIIAEELGFFFAIFLIVLVAIIFFRGLAISRGAREPFGRLLVLGIVSWFAIQSFMNIGAMLSLVPLTGVPLPFVSYGGTAMVLNLCAVGLVLNVSRGTQK